MENPLNIAKALADGNRMRVVAALMRRDELCVCQIVEMLRLATATVSRHMSILQNARLVRNRKDGRWVYYRLAEPFPVLLRKWLLESLSDSREIKADQALLEKILSCDPKDLCQQAKGTEGMLMTIMNLSELVRKGKYDERISKRTDSHRCLCRRSLSTYPRISHSGRACAWSNRSGHPPGGRSRPCGRKGSHGRHEEIQRRGARGSHGNGPARQSVREKDRILCLKQKPSGAVLKIYDPAMCCSSGVCGPSVDPALAQFAGALKFVSSQPGIRIERYNLGQEPQAFVENAQVKSMLGNGGEKRLPFIFINDQLWLQGRYPSREELLDALKIKDKPALFPIAATPESGPCCAEGGCC
ncbi:MAG: arsenite efflux transporter metallochaperone ArsD [Deltaproteobacteria bacterium]|nr:arsenite efflux transporter metallochaperone ArsD [Deltaproteobacteria bacterium]